MKSAGSLNILDHQYLTVILVILCHQKKYISAYLCKKLFPIRCFNQKVYYTLVLEYAKIQTPYHCTMYIYGGSFYMSYFYLHSVKKRV